jgi:hypothetical protein
MARHGWQRGPALEDTSPDLADTMDRKSPWFGRPTVTPCAGSGDPRTARSAQVS